MKNKGKTHKGLQKRVKLTSKGKVRYKSSFSGHLMSSKSGDRCRKLRKARILTGRTARRVRMALSS